MKKQDSKAESRLSAYFLIMMVICIAINVAGGLLARVLNLPFWLDTIGTMAAAVAFGPIPGALVGLISTLCSGNFSGFSLFYLPVSILVGVMIGVLYPRKTKKEALGIVTLALLNGLLSAILSTPVDVLVYQGDTGNLWGDALKDMLDTYVSVSNFNTLVAEIFIDFPDRILSMVLAQVLLFICEKERKNIRKKRAEKKKNSGTQTVSAILIIVLVAPVLSPLRTDAADLGYEYEETSFDTDDGMVSSEANSIIQTSDGYLWVGTYSGLYRYDGVKFEEMKLHDSIRNVKELYVDTKGHMWIGTNDSGVVCYNFEMQTGTLYDTESGMPSDSIRHICEDNKGNIYIATDRELARIDGEGKVRIFSEWADITDVTSLMSVPDGRILGVTQNGLFFILKDDILAYTKAYTGTGVSYYCVASDGDNVVLGTSTDILEINKLKDDGIEIVKKINSKELSSFNTIEYDPGLDLYFCCSEKGMGDLDLKTSEFTNLMKSSMHGSVNDVCVDAQDNIWFASDKHGVVKFSRTPFRNFFNKAGVDKTVVNALYRDGDLMYIGTDTGLKAVDLNSYEEKSTPLTTRIADTKVRHIYKDSTGNIWVSMNGGEGLIYQEPDGNVHAVDFYGQGISTPKCRFVKELSDGRILVSCRNAGLFFIEKGKITSVIGANEGMDNTTILSVYETEDGMLMAGSDGDGVYLIKDGRLVGHKSKTEGLRTGVVMKIVPCTDGFIYVSSNALYYDNGDEIRRLENFPYYDNLDVVIDGAGRAWITSSAGLFVVSEEKLLEDSEYACLLLDSNWGLTTSFTANSWNLLDDGQLYLCCVDGVRVINTDIYDDVDNSFQMRLKLVETQDMKYEQIGSRLVLPAVSGRILFHVAVNNFTLTNPLVHYYLEGTGDPGVTCYQDEITPLSFTNLPYGKYKFHIAILNDMTGEVVREEVIDVEKEAQMYERPLFLIYLSFVNSLIVAYFLWLFIEIQRRNRRIRKLRREIQTDPMTGLLNKAGSHKSIGEACAKENGIMLMIDLDSFKLVNDLHGHEMGDRILIRFAELINEAIKEDDLAGRLGGDEFIAFLKDTSDEDDVEHVCNVLNQGIVKSAKEYMGEDMNIPLGASIGAVRVPNEGNIFDDVFRLADKALYNVKQNGKHGYAFYQKSGSEKDASQTEKNDIKQIKQIIGERNEGKGAFSVNFDRMQVLYKYMNRADRTNGSHTGFFRIMLERADGNVVEDEVMSAFEDMLIRNLKKNDVVSAYGGCFFVLFAAGSEDEYETALQGIADAWNGEGRGDQYKLTYEIDRVG